MHAETGSAALLSPGRPPAAFAAASTLVTAEAQERPVRTIDGEPLASGPAVELGSFNEATIHDLFAGSWEPLIGLQAPAANRSIAPIFCGGHGERSGCFSWCRTFFAGIDALPPTGRPLALRLFDYTNSDGAPTYNTACHPSWWFREPRSPSPAFVFMSLDEAQVRWESGPEGAFHTVLRARVYPNGNSAWRRALAVMHRRHRV